MTLNQKFAGRPTPPRSVTPQNGHDTHRVADAFTLGRKT